MERVQQRKISRTRQLRACTECRKRKLRCDRQLPCSACIGRNQAGDCTYTKTAGLHGEHQHHQLNSSQSCQPTKAEAKLEKLEQLIQEVVRSQKASAHQNSIQLEVSGPQHAGGDLLHDSMHNGATHWSTILEDIGELRNVIRKDNDDTAIGSDRDKVGRNATTGLVFGSTLLSFQQVVSEFLPLRSRADRLVGAYFRTKSITAPFIHNAQFLRHYRLFWDNPSVASPLWTSILFSILEIATKTIFTTCGSGMNEEGVVDRFDIAATQCLAIGECHRPQRFAVEALTLYAQSKCLVCVDLGPEMAILFGTLIRLATAMGYHRDADNYLRRVSPFEGEMRRRTWSMCMQLDLLVSFQLGLPSNVQFPTWDSKPPLNLSNADFDEDTAQLPPERPMTEHTELLLYVAKHKLMAVFEKVIRHTLSTIERPPGELEAIEEEIRNVYENLPVVLHPRSMADSVADSPSFTITRLCINSIYQKCLCVLHRKYVTKGRSTSLQICYTSASDIVSRFLDTYQEFGPGGQLETERWFMGSITWNDFFLGCTTLCLAVCASRQYAAEPADLAVVNISSSLTLLQKAIVVCVESPTKSTDTQRIRRLLEAMVVDLTSHNEDRMPAVPAVFQRDTSEASEALWQPLPSVQGQGGLLFGEDMTTMADDTGWAYMEQFLNLPMEDFVANTWTT